MPSDREYRVSRELRQRLDVLRREHQHFEVLGKKHDVAEVFGIDVSSRSGENTNRIDVVVLAALTSLTRY